MTRTLAPDTRYLDHHPGRGRRSAWSTATAAGAIHLDWPAERIAEAVDDAGDGLGRHRGPRVGRQPGSVEALLRDVFQFHPLAIEDALKETHVPKVDDWGDYLYIVFHTIDFDPETDELRLHELDIFLGPNYLVTYHNEPLDVPRAATAENIERDPANRLQARRRPPALPPPRHGRRRLTCRRSSTSTRRSTTPRTRSSTARRPGPSRRSSGSSGRRCGCTGSSAPSARSSTAWPATRTTRSTGRAPGLLPRRLRPPRPPPRHHREPPRPDLRRPRHLPVGDLEPDQRHHEGPDDRHRHVPADVVPGGFFGMNFFGETLDVHRRRLPKAVALLACACLIMVVTPIGALDPGRGEGAGSERVGWRDANGSARSMTSRAGQVDDVHALATPAVRRRPRRGARAARPGVSPLVAQLLLNRGIDDAAGRATFLEARLTASTTPSTLPGRRRGRRPDRRGRSATAGRSSSTATTTSTASAARASSGPACSWRGAEDVDLLHPPPGRGGLRRQRRGPPAARRRAAGRADRHRRLRDLGRRRGPAGARAGRRADHHRPPHDRRRAARGRRARPPAARREPLPFGDLCGAAVAFKLAWQICKRFGDGKKASPHLRDFLVQLARPGGAGDGGRRRAARRREPDPGPARPGGHARADPTVGLRALLEVCGLPGQEAS